MLGDLGRIAREEADRKAEAEYAALAQRRRAELEANGETELANGFRALENKAKELSQAQPRPSRRKKT